MYQLQDLAALLGVNIPQQTNTTTNNAHVHQLAIEKNNENAQDSLYF